MQAEHTWCFFIDEICSDKHNVVNGGQRLVDEKRSSASCAIKVYYFCPEPQGWFVVLESDRRIA
jgi:hypothetical protein